MLRFLRDAPAPPRILGIRYEYLLKGERWKDKDLAARFGFDARAQRSPLVRGYLNAGMAAGDEQWNVAWDYLKDGGTGETSKLNYRAWKSAPVWESIPIAQWITMLDESAMAVSGDTGGELGYKSAAQATGYLAQHPLDEVFLAPIVIYRNDDDLRDMVEQMEAAERRTAEGVAVVSGASDEGSGGRCSIATSLRRAGRVRGRRSVPTSRFATAGRISAARRSTAGSTGFACRITLRRAAMLNLLRTRTGRRESWR